MKKAFIIVGHSNWGKSATLKELTDGNWRKRYVTIKNKKIFIKRCSNDDIGNCTLLKDFVEKFIKENKHPLLIMTLCPQSEDHLVQKIVEKLSRNYELHFFIYKDKQGKGSSKGRTEISQEEIAFCSKYGKTIIKEGAVEPKDRAVQFKEYIQSVISTH